jgi:polycystin 1L2
MLHLSHSQVVFISIIVPAFFVILYSMEWGRERSNDWLMAMFFSFFQSLFVVDPLKVFLITAIIACILKKSDNSDDDLLIDSGDPYYNAIVNRDEEYLYNVTANLSQIDIRTISEQRNTRLSQLKPIDPHELEKQRTERKKDLKMNEFIQEGAAYIFFLAVVLFLAYQSRSVNNFKLHRDLSNTFLYDTEMAFADVCCWCFLSVFKIYIDMFCESFICFIAKSRFALDQMCGITLRTCSYRAFTPRPGTMAKR